MPYLPDRLKQLVRERAKDRCEYCHLAQAGQVATFHMDHIHPVKEGGTTEGQNLALACVGCSLHKAAKTSALDPETGKPAPLFHPRQEDWEAHFAWDEFTLKGLTPTGRATIVALQLNRPLLVAIREEEAHWGRHP